MKFKLYLILLFIGLKSLTAQINYVNFESVNQAKLDFDNYQIDKSKVVLNLKGTAESSNGTFNYNFPIDFPEGINGATPKLNLAYQSNASEDIMGIGWKLDGLSAISRGAKNYFFDAKSEETQFDNTDPFYLDGQRLIPITGTNGSNLTEYSFEVKNYSKIVSYGMYNGQTNCPQYFEVTLKSGVKMTYGRYNLAQIESKQVISSWLLSRIEDNNGNYIDYFYGKNTATSYTETLLRSIKYGGNLQNGQAHFYEIKFTYGQKDLTSGLVKSYYNNEVKYSKAELITRIEVSKDNVILHAYNLKYTQDEINSYLYKIVKENFNGEISNPLLLKYDYLIKDNAILFNNRGYYFSKNYNVNKIPSVTNRTGNMGGSKINVSTGNQYIYHDFDGDGLQDIIEFVVGYHMMGISIGGGLESYLGALKYNAPYLVKPSKVKFYKNYEDNILFDSKFNLYDSIDLLNYIGPVAYNADEGKNVLVNPNNSLTFVDNNFDGIQDIVMLTSHSISSCPPANSQKLSQIEDVYQLDSIIIFEFDRVTKKINVKKIKANNDLNSFYQKFITEQETYIGLSKNKYKAVSGLYTHRFMPKSFFSGDFDGDGYIDYLNCLEVGYKDITLAKYMNDIPSNSKVDCEMDTMISLFYMNMPKLGIENFKINLNKPGVKKFKNYALLSWSMNVINFNNNGISDIAIHKGDSGIILEWDATIQDFKILQELKGQTPYNYDHVEYGDFNGDGKDDIMYYSDNTGVFTGLSDGKKWINLSTIPSVQKNNNGYVDNHPTSHKRITFRNTPIISDLNGDGMMDISILIDTTFKEEEYVDGEWTNKWKDLKHSYAISNYYSTSNMFLFGGIFKATSKNYWNCYPVDVNGDGNSDWSHMYVSVGINLCNNLENSRRGITDIKTSCQEQTHVNYSRLNHPDCYSNDYIPSDDKQISIGGSSMKVVKSFEVSTPSTNMVTYSYKYKNLVNHRQGKGLLGFGFVQSEDLFGHITQAEYKIEPSYNYIVNMSKNVVISPNESKENTFEYEMVKNGLFLDNRTKKSRILHFKQGNNYPFIYETENEYTGQYDQVSRTVSKTIDDYGLLEMNEVLFSNYLTNGSPYPSKPSTIISRKNRKGDILFEKTAQFEYDSKGNLAKEIDNVGKECQLTSEHSYDVYGNKVSVTQTALSQTPRTMSYQYDAQGNNLLRSYNVMGQMDNEFQYDPIFDRVIYKKDIRGMYTKYEYNDWGQVTSEKEEIWDASLGFTSQSSKNYNRTWDNNNRWDGLYSIETSLHTGQSETSVFDHKGRAVFKIADAPQGKETYQEIVYDDLDRPVLETKPYFLGDNPIYTYKTYYGDLLESYSNEHGTYGVSYWNWQTLSSITTTDPSGKSKTVLTDASDKTVSVIDNLNNKIDYLYNSSGQIRSTLVNNQVYLTNFYNNCGLLTQEQDKSNGNTFYTYDNWGQVLTKKNAKSQIESYTYHANGRKLKYINPEGEVTYSYYNSGNGINQVSKTFLKATLAKENVLEWYMYNKRGQVTLHNKKIGGVSMEKTYAYEKDGRLRTINHSSGVSIKYNYDNKSFLTHISNGSKTLYTINEQNALGQPKLYTLGNGLTTENTYNSVFPSGSHTSNDDGTGNQIPIFKYNVNIESSTGNVFTREYIRNDNNNNQLFQTEQFGYDNLDRLVGIITNGTLKTMQYDNIGNITDKYDVGQYFTNAKNQVIGVSNDAKNISKIEQHISYTSYEQPRYMAEHPNMILISYGANQQRFRTLWKNAYSTGGRIQATTDPTLIAYRDFDPAEFHTMKEFKRLRYYFDDYEITTHSKISPTVYKASNVHYIRGVDGKIVCIIQKPFELNVDIALNTIVNDIPDPLPSDGSFQSNSGGTVLTPTEDISFPPRGSSIPPPSAYYYVYTDHLGSLLTFTDENADIVHEQNFDAWGRYRNVDNISQDLNGNQTHDLFYRGYTEHEHLGEFELINMNGRVYDPLLGRFLSTDASINDPTIAQCYNRYTYCLNNPLKYTDPSGEVIQAGMLIAGAFFSYALNCAVNEQRPSLMGGLTSMGFSILSSAASFGVGEIVQVVGFTGLKELLLSTTLHTIVQTSISTATGGDLGSSLLVSFISSATGGLTSDISAAISSNANTQFYLSFGFGALIGGTTDIIAGGDGWRGAVVGASISAFNHSLHRENPGDNSKSNTEKVLDFAESLYEGVTSDAFTLTLSSLDAQYPYCDALALGLKFGAGVNLKFLRLARTFSANKVGTTVLGHYPEYVELAKSIGARRFQIPPSVWNKMSVAEQWAANTKFLDRMITRGDNIRLATPLNQVKQNSWFAKELEYLFGKGYKVSSDGLWLAK